jgi:hypothetical protein
MPGHFFLIITDLGSNYNVCRSSSVYDLDTFDYRQYNVEDLAFSMLHAVCMNQGICIARRACFCGIWWQ